MKLMEQGRTGEQHSHSSQGAHLFFPPITSTSSAILTLHAQGTALIAVTAELASEAFPEHRATPTSICSLLLQTAKPMVDVTLRGVSLAFLLQLV